MVYVVDNSVVLKWFFTDEELSDKAIELLTRFLTKRDHLIGPENLLAEFGGAVRWHYMHENITAERAQEVMDRYLALGIEAVPMTSFASEAMQIALRFQGQFYDALYVALAKARGCRVITADGGMRQSFRPLDCVIDLQDLVF